ncbi:MAG: RNA polymerase sigma factor RpoD/SigA [Planctomycetota bacterium]|nr:RNA polymerase sigma factor RpoD/SigA [Planctomycetota bacterium]
MTLASKTRSKPPRLSLGQFVKGLPRRGVVTWAHLDTWLEGDSETFARETKRLAKGLDKIEIRVVGIPPSAPEFDPPYQFHSSLRSDGVLPYEREVGKRARLSRAGEFRFARRYEFLRLRAKAALLAAGFGEDLIKALLVQGDLDKAEWPAKAMKSRTLIDRVVARVTEFEELRNGFLEGSLYLVMKGVHRYRGLGIDTADLVQEGNVSLFQAVEGFDWRRDVRFKTYAEYWINQAFLKMLYNNVRTVRVPVWVQKLLKKIKDLQKASEQENGRKLTSTEVGRRLDIPAAKVEELLKTQRYAVSLDAEIGGNDDGGRMGDLLEDRRYIPVPEQVVDVRLRDRLGEVLNHLPERERTILTQRFGLDGKPPRTLFEVGQLLGVSAERIRQLQEVALKRLRLPQTQGRLRGFMSA